MTEDDERMNEEHIEVPDDSYDEWRDVCMEDFVEGIRSIVSEVTEQKHNYVSRHGEGGAWMYAALISVRQAISTGTIKDLYDLQSYLKSEMQQLQQAIDAKQKAIDERPLPFPFKCVTCGRENTATWDQNRATRYTGPKLVLVCKCGSTNIAQQKED